MKIIITNFYTQILGRRWYAYVFFADTIISYNAMKFKRIL